MQKLTDRKQINSAILLFSLAYMVSHIARTNFGAVISEMQTATGISKTLLSAAVTGGFITYGAGQVISGIAGDKLSPKKLLLCGLLISTLTNFVIPFCTSPWQMIVVWSINGFAQSLKWPPLTKIMSSVFSDRDYKTAVERVSYGSSIGTISMYLFSPLLIMAAGWKSVFFASAAVAAIMCFAWNKFAVDADASDMHTERRTKTVKTEKRKSLFTPTMVCIMLVIIIHGMLRDGVITWMPSYISETYGLGNEISILSGVILPIFGMICVRVSAQVHKTKLKNPITCAAAFFGVGVPVAAALAFVTGHNAAASVFMSALFIGCMYGADLMLVSILPNYFKDTGKVSTVSGLLNACTYVGSAISSFGFASLSEAFGWGSVIWVWVVAAACGTVICVICRRAKMFKTNATK